MSSTKYRDPEIKADVGDFIEGSKDFYNLLSSIFYLELTHEQIEGLANDGFRYPDDDCGMGQACKKIRRYLARRGNNATQELAVDYARIFLSAGIYEGKTAVPFESVYTSNDGLMMQDSRDDVVQVYAMNGLMIPPDLHVPEDHLSFELEFMAHVSERIVEGMRVGSSVLELLQIQRDFIDSHLLNWIPQLQDRVDTYAKLPFYPAILSITQSYLVEHRAVIEEALAGHEGERLKPN